MPSSSSADWPLQGVEENAGMDSLPFRLMLQDCTAVKTLLLKMKRVLQEVMISSKIILSVLVDGEVCRPGQSLLLSLINCMTLGKGQVSS